MNDAPLNLPSFAKLNWRLHVLGKRPDGYHEIVTVLQTISLSDELTFSLRNDASISLSCDDPRIPTDARNLIVKAALALQERLQSPQGAAIELTKRIPSGGGLGGASSNAAVALLALNRLWRAQLPATDLMRIGNGLGADVPFFLIGGRAAGTGIGADVTALAEGPKHHLIIITPSVAVATATAYTSLNAPSLTTSDSASILSSSFAEIVSSNSRQPSLHNDFEGVLFEIEPEIKRVKAALLDAGARGALLAGSGSSVFGIFSDEAARDRALGHVRSEAGWRVFSCSTISRAEYFQAMGPAGFSLLTLS